MRAFSLVLASFLLLSTLTARADALSDAKQILDRYLKAPRPIGPSKTDPYDPEVDKQVNGARLARLSILAELKAMPREYVSAAERVLFEQADPEQRFEIVGALGDSIHTSGCAELLHRVLQDAREPKDEKAALYEELVRSSAVHGLRRMSTCTDRSGGMRIQRKPDFVPEVPGLVPYLISAANDQAERVRVSALYALADSRNPAAVAELRNRLGDKSENVRLYAACFLTEYQDASGLPEMRTALLRFRKGDLEPKVAFEQCLQVEMLLASLERITGKSFGEIPFNPMLSSSSRGEEAKRYAELLGVWEAWWNWQPEPKADKNP